MVTAGPGKQDEEGPGGTNNGLWRTAGNLPFSATPYPADGPVQCQPAV